VQGCRGGDVAGAGVRQRTRCRWGSSCCSPSVRACSDPPFSADTYRSAARATLACTTCAGIEDEEEAGVGAGTAAAATAAGTNDASLSSSSLRPCSSSSSPMSIARCRSVVIALRCNVLRPSARSTRAPTWRSDVDVDVDRCCCCLDPPRCGRSRRCLWLRVTAIDKDGAPEPADAKRLLSMGQGWAWLPPPGSAAAPAAAAAVKRSRMLCASGVRSPPRRRSASAAASAGSCGGWRSPGDTNIALGTSMPS
jgi:hypothetical protein